MELHQAVQIVADDARESDEDNTADWTDRIAIDYTLREVSSADVERWEAEEIVTTEVANAYFVVLEASDAELDEVLGDED